MHKLTTAIASAAFAAAAISTAAAPAQADEFYRLYLTGVQVVQEGPHRGFADSDNPFIVAYMVEEDGEVTRPVFIPSENEPWRDLNAGDILTLDTLVWQGPSQTAMLQAHVYNYDSSAQDFFRGFVAGTTAISGALIAVGTGGLGAAGGAAIAIGGQHAADAVHNAVGADHVPLGVADITLELDRAAAYADRPYYEHYGIWYDFYTEHSYNGALYGLFWDLRR